MVTVCWRLHILVGLLLTRKCALDYIPVQDRRSDRRGLLVSVSVFTYLISLPLSDLDLADIDVNKVGNIKKCDFSHSCETNWAVKQFFPVSTKAVLLCGMHCTC